MICINLADYIKQLDEMFEGGTHTTDSFVHLDPRSFPKW